MTKAEKDLLIKYIREKGRKVLTSDAIELDNKYIEGKALIELIRSI